MRDKVKRFISILMTALMLVNLMPVGALADGITSGGYRPETVAYGNQTVYLYVKVTGNLDGLNLNKSGWCTVGKATVPNMMDPYSYAWRHGKDKHVSSVYGISADDVGNGNVVRFEKNQSINLSEVTWSNVPSYGFLPVSSGADDYVWGGWTWHLDGYIDVSKVKASYKIRYVDQDTDKVLKEAASGTDDLGASINHSAPSELEGGYKIVGETDRTFKLDTVDDNEFKIYYRRPYTVTYVPGEHGTFADDPHTAKYGDPTPAFAGETTGEPGWTFAGWTPEVADKVTGNVTYTAQWTQNEYTVKYNPGDHGTFEEKDHTYIRHYNDLTPAYDEKNPTAIPDGEPGWTFDGWTPDVAPTVTENATYVAQWKPDTSVTAQIKYEVYEGQNGFGHVNPGAETIQAATGNLTSGDPLEGSTATAHKGYTFEGWYKVEGNKRIPVGEKGNPVLNGQTVFNALTKDKNELYKDAVFWAKFVPDENATVSVTYNAENGTLEGTTSQEAQIVTGEGLTDVTVKPNPGYKFSHWEKNKTAIKGASETLDAETAKNNLNKDGNLYATTTFTAVCVADENQMVSVIYTKDENGILYGGPAISFIRYSVNIATGKVWLNGSFVDKLESVPVYPKEGYEFDRWIRVDPEKTIEDAGSVLTDDKARPNLNRAANGLYQETTFKAIFRPRTDLSYTVNYLEKGNTGNVLHAPKSKTGIEFGAKIEPSKEVITIDGYTYDSADKETLTIGIDNSVNVLNLYYTKNNYAYTVEHYWIGDKNNPDAQPFQTDDDERQIAPYGSKVYSTSWVITTNTAYTFAEADPGEITIGIDPKQNVLKLYYYKNVTLTANSATKTYNGSEQSVSGYDCSVKGLTFEGITAGATGTNVGEYQATFNTNPEDPEFPKNKLDTTGNYIVKEAIPGKLTINPVDEVVVTITGHNDTVTYDGKDHEVTGYDVSIDNDLYKASDFEFSGTAEAKGTDAGTYQMGLKAEQFTNTNDNFKKVTFKIADGKLTINPVDEVVVTITGHNDTVTYDGKEHDVTGYDVSSISNSLYTEDYFTFSGTAEAKGTDAGTYQMGLKAEQFANANGNFKKVTFKIADGKLTINPVDEVVVTITGHNATVPYDGKDHEVTGYDVSIDNDLYKASDFEFSGTAEAKGTDADTYQMGLKAEQFTNTNGNFKKVTFVVEKDGQLVINKRSVTLTSATDSKVYDGNALTNDTVTVGGEGFADNEGAAYDVTGSQTLAGSSENTFTYTLNEGTLASNYIITPVLGILTVTDGTEEKPVDPTKVITKTHEGKVYNLNDKVDFEITVTNIYDEQKEVTLEERQGVTFEGQQGKKTLAPGEKWTIQATYTITSADILAGSFTNTVKAIFGDKSWTAEDTVATAELNTALNVTKTSNVKDGQKAALGQKITYTITVRNEGNVPYTNVTVEDPLTKLTATIETLAVGETKTFTTEYVVTEEDVRNGHVLNKATAKGDKIKDPTGDEKQPNGDDELEIKTFAPITVKPKDVTATYNGAAITGKDVEITSGKLLEGHKLSAAVDGSGVNAGSYALTINPAKIKIVDANNNDVSKMYARTVLPGELIINKRSVLITSQSATKTYDGSALTRPAVTITGDGFVPGELAKAEATGSITNVGSTPNAIQYTTTGAFNAANYSIALSVGTLTVTERPQPEPRRTFNLTVNYVYQNGKRAAASYNRGGLKNGETFDITSPVIAGYTASETVVSGTIYNRDIKVTVIYTADGVNLDDYGVPLGLGNITMNVGDCFE